MRYYLFVLFTMLLIVLQASSAFAVAPIKGVVTAKRGDTLKVEFQVNKQVVPQPGDQVEFFQMLEGYPAEAGTGKVVKNDGNAVWVQTNDSHPDLTMNALIHATGIVKKQKLVKKTSTPPLHPCDELAGDPWDNQRLGPSVNYFSINATQAISVCEDAVKKYPAEDRFSFQLARAYTANKQYKSALFYYNLAAVPGNYAAAQYNLGVMYEKGYGIAEDDKKAFKWYLKAAEQNHGWAKYQVGLNYLNGKGVPKNDVMAVKWFQKAAELGNANAQNNLGWLYAAGKGVEQNYTEAVKWYSKSAEQNNSSGQYLLGWSYDFGKGVEQNYAEAVKWYSKSAEQNQADAQYHLALLYYKGLGVPKNRKQIVHWLKKAALQGHEKAKKKLVELGE